MGKINFMKKIYIYLLKNHYMNKLKKYGKCEITKDQIICLVDGMKLKQNSNKQVAYFLELMGFQGEDEQILEFVGINKPIKYIVENINFDKTTYINSGINTEIIFKECEFNETININSANKITFENNKYITKTNFDKKEIFWISCRKMEDANHIKFKNDNLIAIQKGNNPIIQKKERFVNPYLNAKKIEIVDCGNINSDKLHFVTKELIVENTTINSEYAYIKTLNIEGKNSKIFSNNGIVIEEDRTNNIYIENVISPYVIDDKVTSRTNNQEEASYTYNVEEYDYTFDSIAENPKKKVLKK